MAVDEKEKCCLAILSVSGAAVKSMCRVTTILDSGSGISTMSESVPAKLLPAVPDIQIMATITNDQYVEMVDGKLVLVKQTSCPVRTALHAMWGPVVMNPVYIYIYIIYILRYFAGQGGRDDLGEPTSSGSGN